MCFHRNSADTGVPFHDFKVGHVVWKGVVEYIFTIVGIGHLKGSNSSKNELPQRKDFRKKQSR